IRIFCCATSLPRSLRYLLRDLRDDAGADGATALANREAEALVHGDRLDQLHRHLRVVPRHDHLLALRQRDLAGDVGGAEVELRPVLGEERRVAASLLLAEDIDLGP